MAKKWTFVFSAFLLATIIIIFINLRPYLPQFTSPEHLADYIRSFGTMTIVVSLLLMVLQTLCTPLPLFLLAGANGFIFGLGYGVLITMAGSLLGASLAFYLAGALGEVWFLGV
ncbi:hypothetical protein N752_01750 [Desulforamulus aquiferis]|nr:hypothetical protein [Desulforamulus aquiferis]RYD06877.1 hypothetical protein N752_01750 [Desulforamulus aquiferis]